jgi:hypothetical protein
MISCSIHTISICIIRLVTLIHTWNVLGFFPGSIPSRIHTMTFAFHVSALKCSYGALYQALNKRSVSDLSASVEQEIRKDGAVLASQHPFWKDPLIEKGRGLKCPSSQRESLRLRNLRLSLCCSSLVGATFSQFLCLNGLPVQSSRSSVSWLSPLPRASVLRQFPLPRSFADRR